MEYLFWFGTLIGLLSVGSVILSNLVGLCRSIFGYLGLEHSSHL